MFLHIRAFVATKSFVFLADHQQPKCQKTRNNTTFRIATRPEFKIARVFNKHEKLIISKNAKNTGLCRFWNTQNAKTYGFLEMTNNRLKTDLPSSIPDLSMLFHKGGYAGSLLIKTRSFSRFALLDSQKHEALA